MEMEMNAKSKNGMEMQSYEDSPYLIEIETLKDSGSIRSVFGAIKTQLHEATIQINDDKLEILQADPTHMVLVHLELFARNFHSYRCNQPIKIGLNLVNIDKILKCVQAKDQLTIFVEDPQHANYSNDSALTYPFGFMVQRSEKSEIRKILITPMEPSDELYQTPNLDCSAYEIEMPSADVCDIINHMKAMGGQVVHIIYNKETLTFFTKGENGQAETNRYRSMDNESNMNVKKSTKGDSEIISIYVNLQKLVEFIKCTTLSTIVTLYLNNDTPLIMVYKVGTLGTIKLGVATRPKPDDW